MKKTCPICHHEIKHGKCVFCGHDINKTKTYNNSQTYETYDTSTEDFSDDWDEDEKEIIEDKNVETLYISKLSFFSIVFPGMFFVMFAGMPISLMLLPDFPLEMGWFMTPFILVGLGAAFIMIKNICYPSIINKNGEMLNGKVIGYKKSKRFYINDCPTNVLIFETYNKTYNIEIESFKKPAMEGETITVKYYKDNCIIIH